MEKGQTTICAICCGGLDMAGRPAVVEVRGAYTRIRPLELSRRACLDSFAGKRHGRLFEEAPLLPRPPPPPYALPFPGGSSGHSRSEAAIGVPRGEHQLQGESGSLPQVP